MVEGLRAGGWVDACQTSTLTIVMVMWPGVDYHFYRLVTGASDWWWEHKPGSFPVTWTDNQNRNLRDPLSPINCDRGKYTDFCGYFYRSSNTTRVA